jgi:hypothetical protein
MRRILTTAAAVLTAEEMAVASAYYDIGEIGDMHHNPAKNVLHVRGTLEGVAKANKISLDEAKARIRKLQNGRIGLPPEPPYVEPHNTWVVNRPSTLLVIPVGDLAQHTLLGLCYFLQNGSVIRDDINGRPIPGIEKFKGIVNVENTWPLTFVEQWAMTEVTAELATSCYAGVLMLQAMGLGGWMFNGIDPFSVLGASGKPEVPGLRFRFDVDDRWPYPNYRARQRDGRCRPPHYTDMSAAVEAVCERKFGLGGPFHPETPGPWKDSPYPLGRPAAQRRIQRVRRPTGPVCVRHLRQVPRHCAFSDRNDLSAGSSPRSRVL